MRIVEFQLTNAGHDRRIVVLLNDIHDTGDHSVEVKLSGSHVEGSPFLVKAYNADKVKVTDINSGVVGKPVFFSSKITFCTFTRR